MDPISPEGSDFFPDHFYIHLISNLVLSFEGDITRNVNVSVSSLSHQASLF